MTELAERLSAQVTQLVIIRHFDRESIEQALNLVRRRNDLITCPKDACMVFEHLLYGLILLNEIDKRQSKRLLPVYALAAQQNPAKEQLGKVILRVLLSIPMMVQSRWDLFTLLYAARLLPDVPDPFFAELEACSVDQDLSARCSAAILNLSVDEKYCDRVAGMIYRGMVSPSQAHRNNVHRNWFCRIINNKHAKRCVEKILSLCRTEVEQALAFMWPVTFRELSGITCTDLQWKCVLEDEPFERITFVHMAYYSVLLSIKCQGSQVKVKLPKDDVVLTRGIEYHVPMVAKQAVLVCSAYKFYPPNLEKTILSDAVLIRNPAVTDLIDDEMLKSFSKEGQYLFPKERLKLRWEMGQKLCEAYEMVKHYPATDDGNLKVEVNMHSEINAIKTLQRFFKIQSPTEVYPSVAAVMETLSSQNIDERLFCQKVFVIVDIVLKQYADHKFSRLITTQFIFQAITRIPLRAVVDYVGEKLKKQCKEDVLFREKIFRMALDLLQTEEDNARPLSLMHCFTSTAHLERHKVTQVWQTIKTVRVGEKKRKMSEMLAKVVQSSEIDIYAKDLHDMIICSLAFKPDEFDVESTQLFVSAVSRFLKFRNETDRVLLIQVIHRRPELVQLIDEILSTSPSSFTKSSLHMVLYLFTRFYVGTPKFYHEQHLRIIARIVNFCHWAVRKYHAEPMIVSIAVDAIAGYFPWSYVRESALSKEPKVPEDAVEALIHKHLHHHRYWQLLHDHDKSPEQIVTVEDLEQLPAAEFIVRILKNPSQETLEEMAKEFKEMLRTQKSFEQMHANYLAFGMLIDKSLEMMKDAIANKVKDPVWKNRIPTRRLVETLIDASEHFDMTIDSDSSTAYTNQWHGKVIGKLKVLRACYIFL
ncbi:unnamed protein product [Caenorhabditis sp. 36 PRJEB53466]|nr:unnamed protein product [Caenorhabditis sp. 36 PRJEB53466]